MNEPTELRNWYWCSLGVLGDTGQLQNRGAVATGFSYATGNYHNNDQIWFSNDFNVTAPPGRYRSSVLSLSGNASRMSNCISTTKFKLFH